MTEGQINALDERLQMAKRRVSLAVLASLRGSLDAWELVGKALGEIDGARKALHAWQAQQAPQAHADDLRASEASKTTVDEVNEAEE